MGCRGLRLVDKLQECMQRSRSNVAETRLNATRGCNDRNRHMVAGGHTFDRHLQQDTYAVNLACKDQVSIIATTGQRLS